MSRVTNAFGETTSKIGATGPSGSHPNLDRVDFPIEGIMDPTLVLSKPWAVLCLAVWRGTAVLCFQSGGDIAVLCLPVWRGTAVLCFQSGGDIAVLCFQFGGDTAVLCLPVWRGYRCTLFSVWRGYRCTLSSIWWGYRYILSSSLAGIPL